MKRVAKLLMIVDDVVAGGAFKVGERLAHGLVGTHHVLFACDRSPVNEASRHALARAGVEILGLFAHAGDARRAICDRPSALALLERAAPDQILFIDSSPRSSIALKDMARALGISYVAQVNFVDRVTPTELTRWDADVVRAADGAAANVFVSAAARGDFETNFPQVTAPRAVVTNGVPDDFFRPVDAAARRALRADLGIGDDDVMLLLPGRLESRKGQHVALAALARLVARGDGPRLRLVLAGHGDDEERQALVDAMLVLDLVGHAHYLGPRTDLPHLFDACDLVLMPSRQEADPLVSKEAMAKGRPVVASDLPGVREQGHAEAMLVPAPDGASQATVDGLVAKIDELRRSPAKRTAIGHRLRSIADERFTMAHMIDAYLRILETLPAPAGKAPSPVTAPTLGRWMEMSDAWQTAPLKDGWADVEEEGIWSLGLRSRIAFKLDHPARSVVIRLKVRAFAPPGVERTFDVRANGAVVAAWTFADRRPTVKTIRVSLATPKRTIVVALRGKAARSPFDLGVSADRRKLGLHLYAMRIDAVADGTALPSDPGRIVRLWRGHSARLVQRVVRLWPKERA